MISHCEWCTRKTQEINNQPTITISFQNCTTNNLKRSEIPNLVGRGSDPQILLTGAMWALIAYWKPHFLNSRSATGLHCRICVVVSINWICSRCKSDIILRLLACVILAHWAGQWIMSVLRGEHWNPYVYSWMWLLMLSARLHLSLSQAVCHGWSSAIMRLGLGSDCAQSPWFSYHIVV